MVVPQQCFTYSMLNRDYLGKTIHSRTLLQICGHSKKKYLCCQVTVLCESFDILQCIQWCHDQGYDPEQKTNNRTNITAECPWSVIQPTKLTRLNDRCHVNGQEVCIHVNAAVVIYQSISLALQSWTGRKMGQALGYPWPMGAGGQHWQESSSIPSSNSGLNVGNIHLIFLGR